MERKRGTSPEQAQPRPEIVALLAGDLGDDPGLWSKSIYKETACGAWIAFPDPDTICLGSIVEGSQAETDVHTLTWPFTTDQFRGALDAIERQADEISRETANADEDDAPPAATHAPSCETCVHHVWDRGDSDVGIGPSIECENDEVSESLLDTESDPIARAAQCGCYQVVMAAACGHCGRPLDIPITKVQFWCAHVHCEPSPGCSADCANAAEAEAACILQENCEPNAFWELPDRPECPHGKDPSECQDCLALGDFLADCDRERRHFGR